MFGFFKEVNIHQGRDCYDMWLILRVKWGKWRRSAPTLPFRHILFVGGNEIIGWGYMGFAPAVWYSMFKV